VSTPTTALSILVVDDDAPLRDMHARSFTREGHTVTAVGDGQAALEATAAAPFDIIRLDVALGPGLAGHDVARELRSRIRAVMRRAHGRLLDENVVQNGDVLLNRRDREVQLRGEPVKLTFSEYELLQCLMSRPGHLFNRQELLRAIWGDSAYRDPRAIDVHIRHLREKLEERPDQPALILTVRGAGYRVRGG